jgi:hypothetical protein
MPGILKQWLTIAAVAAVLCGLVFVAVQHALREGADDPQIEIAEDAASALAAGVVVPPTGLPYLKRRQRLT